MPKVINVTAKASATDQNVAITIPDPLPTLSGNTIGFSQADPAIVVTGGTPIPVPVPTPSPDQNFIFDMQDISVVDYVRPDAGANQFYSGNGQQSPIPDKTKPFTTLNNDVRFNWSDFESNSGVYNFSKLDSAIATCKANGWKLSFRIVSVDSSNTSQIYPTIYGTTKDPDFNSESYLAGVEKLMLACAAYCQSKNYFPYIAGIDKSCQGNWGEDHYFSISSKPATSASTKRLFDATINAFPNTRVFITISGLASNSNIPVDAAYYQLMGKNNVGLVGIRSDHLGDAGNFDFDTSKNPQSYNGVMFKDIILIRGKDAPMKGELLNNLSGVNAASPYSDLLREAQLYGLSQFSNSNEARRSGSGATAAQIAASDANLLAVSKAIGARISMPSASIKNGVLTLNWANTGNAPIYDNWDVYLLCGTQQIKSNAVIKGMFLGPWFSTDQLPAGSYSLSVIIKDTNGYRSPYPLLNKNRLTDGSYKIGDIKI